MSNCDCPGAMPVIKQGDDVFLQLTLYFNGEPITAAALPLLEEIEYCFREAEPLRIPAGEAWSETLGVFLLPVTQAQTLALENGPTELDVRVKFRGGNVLGARQKAKLRVLDATSEEVL